ncbi:hypothetical protein DICPUDRAFT_148463 [Dictyostelium purpureum]|uniref:Dilute domain-containing protein n=1 Tax=Dictyostelium purpureum TaxID=5786 RepID=F0ZB70_DICPU|nr:uncharacterized protein DICPUDRAFT_148463 [Dictyostelium purpureum]EGC38790.1 hypothetical protein DICPUDRAFT_148463 [Dictyostelium purpureum]|eukprot:XP_003284684.1 hypothetical protein DICPUDRAFT_148463 [Dictyostelium purpureum]
MNGLKKVLGYMGNRVNEYMNPDSNDNNANRSPPVASVSNQQQSSPPQQPQNTNKKQDKRHNDHDDDDDDDDGLKQEIELFKSSLKITNTSSSDLDILIIRINDKITKNDFEEGLKLLKQFVYLVFEGLTSKSVNTLQNAGTTYTNLFEKYHIPSLMKLEELYQTSRSKIEETMRTNNETSLIQLSIILSIVQQIKYKVLVRQQQQQQQQQQHQQQHQQPVYEEEDEGLNLYIQFQRKLILQDSGPIIKDMIRVNETLEGMNDIKSKVNSIDNCLLALKKVLSSVVQKISDTVHVSSDQWRWNQILHEKYQTKLNEWNSNYLTLPLHNQSAMYLDKIYTIILDKIKDDQLITEANLSIEDLINNFRYSQEEIESIQPYLGIDELLNQISSISEISQRYINYIQANAENGKKLPELNNMKSRIQEILTHYTSLEAQYFQLSFSFSIYGDDLRKLISIEMDDNNQKNQHQQQQSNDSQHDRTNSQQRKNNEQLQRYGQENNTSSMVDDIFFIFRKVVARAISTSSSPTTCAIINLTLTNFDIIYIPYFENLLQYTLNPQDFDQRRDTFLIILNNLTLTNDYINQVQHQLKDTTLTKFKEENDIKMINICIEGDGFSSIVKHINNIIKVNVDKIINANSVFLNRFMWPFNNINYEITDEEFENYEINDPFVMDFLSNLMELLGPYKRKFMAVNFDQMVHLMSTYIAKNMEELIMKKRFNQLGGIQLSKDIRKIIEFLCNITTEQNIRHKFTRLSQISHLLTFDKANDIYEYWGQEGYVWKLSALEIKLVLGRRSDFKGGVNNLNIK